MAAGSTRRNLGKMKVEALSKVKNGSFKRDMDKLEASKVLAQRVIKELNISNRTLNEAIKQLTVQVKKNENIVRTVSRFLGKEEMNYDKFLADAKAAGLIQSSLTSVYRRMRCTDIKTFITKKDMPALKRLSKKHKADNFCGIQSERGEQLVILHVKFNKNFEEEMEDV